MPSVDYHQWLTLRKIKFGRLEFLGSFETASRRIVFLETYSIVLLGPTLKKDNTLLLKDDRKMKYEGM